MDQFLQQKDELAARINTAALLLHEKLQKLDPDSLGMPEYCLNYYKVSHSGRLFFSIETSASLLYRSFRLIDKTPEEAVVMDYGAGVGTLYLLAKMIGCKLVIYNDHLEDWKISAALIANAIGVHIDHYIVGDIESCFDRLERFNISCDLIASRNVIEHIYRLDLFYATIHKRQPQAVVVASTTANQSNPLAVVKHRLWHRKWEKVYKGKRLVMIERKARGLTRYKISMLASKTQGLAGAELEEAIEDYRKTGKLPNPASHKSNTCDPVTGVWAEHLLSRQQYRDIINTDDFDVRFLPGFWDTHYSSNVKNLASKFINRFIASTSEKGMSLAPFIYVIATPR